LGREAAGPSAFLSLLLSAELQLAQLLHQRGAELLGDVKAFRKLGERLLVHVQAPCYLDLNGVDVLEGPAVVSRAEATLVRVVVAHAPAKLPRQHLGGLLDFGRGAGSASRTRNDISARPTRIGMACAPLAGHGMGAKKH